MNGHLFSIKKNIIWFLRYLLSKLTIFLQFSKNIEKWPTLTSHNFWWDQAIENRKETTTHKFPCGSNATSRLKIVVEKVDLKTYLWNLSKTRYSPIFSHGDPTTDQIKKYVSNIFWYSIYPAWKNINFSTFPWSHFNLKWNCCINDATTTM